jgi:MinD-like ATPase involved in chromosome partitioning or flagellar assembly
MGFYLEIIRNVFQALDDEGKLRNRIVAFTSATRGEGVSYVVNTIARELAEQTHKRVLAVDAVGLQKIHVPEPSHVVRHCSETHLDNLLTLPAEAKVGGLVGIRKPPEVKDWHSDPEYRAACLKALRWNFDYIIVDCPALAVSSDATLLAPLIDGVAIVVQAGKTRRAQIQRARQTVENADGEFLGFVLNQRRYSVPNWLYQRL